MRIVKYPHPALRYKCKPLARVDAELRSIVQRMFELMYAHKGIGLSANQVDLPYRLFVLNPSGDPAATDQQMVFINPVILRRSGSQEDEEGCLSFPDIFAPVRRPNQVTVVAYNLEGNEVTCEFQGLTARAVQHEYDHLDGVLFIDRMSPGALLSIKQELAELELEFAGQRRQGLIPDDKQIAARLRQLEMLRA